MDDYDVIEEIDGCSILGRYDNKVFAESDTVFLQIKIEAINEIPGALPIN